MKRAPRLLATCVGAALLVSTGCAGGNALAFDARARAVERQLAAYIAEGVPGPALEGVRADLHALQASHRGPLPYSVVSGAALADPFQALEERAAAIRRQAVDESRLTAEAALEELRHQPGAATWLADDAIELGQASTPAGYRLAAARMRTQAVEAQVIRRELADAGGGLTDGQPADIVAGMSRLRELIAAADQMGLTSDPGPDSLVDSELYLALPYPQLVDHHAAAADELNLALHTLQRRLDTRAHAVAIFGQLPGLLGQAAGYGAGDTYPARAEQYRQELLAAHDDPALARAAADLQGLVDEISGAVGSGRLPLAGVACIDGAPTQLIAIHLASQQLIAYDSGCPILRTPITTGRPALPTDRGTFRIFYKTPAYKMVSPWPQGSPFYYPPTWVYWAMEFVGDGTFIHNADWQPDSSYGPGSQYGPYASHGCVHVMDAPLQSLYAWAQVGATVMVGD